MLLKIRQTHHMYKISQRNGRAWLLLQTFRNLYRGKQREIDRIKLEDTEEWTKVSVLSKIVSYIYETEKEVPGSVFDAKCLETMYIELLKCHNIQITSHVTRFADKLLTQDGTFREESNWKESESLF